MHQVKYFALLSLVSYLIQSCYFFCLILIFKTINYNQKNQKNSN
jgi:hypothetical protein